MIQCPHKLPLRFLWWIYPKYQIRSPNVNMRVDDIGLMMMGE